MDQVQTAAFSQTDVTAWCVVLCLTQCSYIDMLEIMCVPERDMVKDKQL